MKKRAKKLNQNERMPSGETLREWAWRIAREAARRDGHAYTRRSKDGRPIK